MIIILSLHDVACSHSPSNPSFLLLENNNLKVSNDSLMALSVSRPNLEVNAWGEGFGELERRRRGGRRGKGRERGVSKRERVGGWGKDDGE